MFARYWKYVLAFGFIAAGLVCGLLYADYRQCLNSVDREYELYQAEQSQRSEYSSQKENVSIGDQAVPLLVLQEHNREIAARSADADEGKQAEPFNYEPKADLCAQNSMSLTTIWIALFTGLGLVMLVLTLAEAEETSRHAANMLSQQKDTDIRTLRAYLSAEEFGIDQLAPGHKPRILFNLKNTGSSPSRETCISASVGVYLPGECDYNMANPFRLGENLYIAPGQTMKVTASFDTSLDEKMIAKLLSGESVLSFYGYITYRDIYRKRRRLVFNWHLSPDQFEGDKGCGMFSASTKHNAGN